MLSIKRLADSISSALGSVHRASAVSSLQPRCGREGGLKALVLSGGGAKGCFQAGAVRRLWREGFRPDVICGVSVGAINGAKLAEGRDSSAEELVDNWRRVASGEIKLVKEDLAFGSALRLLRNDLMANIARFPFEHRLLDHILHRGLGRLHAIHSWGHCGFPGLLGLINQELDPEAIASSGIKLFIGITDLETGSLWQVTPDLHRFEDPAFGVLEREPDFTSPLAESSFGMSPEPQIVVMGLASAIFASSAMPVFMPPVQAWFNDDDPRPGVTRVTTALPASYRELLPCDGTFVSFSGRGGLALEPPFPCPPTRHFMDGGLVDVIPIRTAMRLGAREIVVVSAAPLFEEVWTHGEDQDLLGRIPFLQYHSAMISTWVKHIARNNLALATAYNEFLGWQYHLFSLLDNDTRTRVIEEFDSYWREHGRNLREALGVSTGLGGFSPFMSETSDQQAPPYGITDEACKISLIAPDPLLWDSVDVLDFEDGDRLLEGIKHGEERAQRPIELSFPVPAIKGVDGNEPRTVAAAR